MFLIRGGGMHCVNATSAPRPIDPMQCVTSPVAGN